MTAEDERIRDYVAGLPGASGTFTGTFSPEAVERLLGPVPELLPVEVDTYNEPNPAAALGEGQFLTITSGDRTWTFPVDHAEPLDGNRIRVWCKRPA